MCRAFVMQPRKLYTFVWPPQKEVGFRKKWIANEMMVWDYFYSTCSKQLQACSIFYWSKYSHNMQTKDPLNTSLPCWLCAWHCSCRHINDILLYDRHKRRWVFRQKWFTNEMIVLVLVILSMHSSKYSHNMLTDYPLNTSPPCWLCAWHCSCRNVNCILLYVRNKRRWVFWKNELPLKW